MMNKPKRQPSFGARESLQGPSRLSSRLSSVRKGPRTTPLLRTTKRVPLSAAKTNQRESYIGTASHHTMKDPRPISDRPYMKKCVMEIIHLLGALNYPNQVYLKMFNPPSNKEYQRVFEFLTLQILGSYRILGKPDEEMLKVVKDLGYPFNVSKSNLNNVGTMSSWPQALGVLHWIADLAKYSMGCDDAIEESLSLNSKKKVKQEYYYRTYQEFMRGDDGPYNDLLTQVKQTIDELDADAVKEYEKQQAISKRLTATYDEKIKEKDSMSRLSEEIADTRVNIGKIKQYLLQCDNYIDSIKAKTEQFQQTINKQKEEIANVNEAICQLKSTVSQQQLSQSDIEQMALDKQRLKDATRAAIDRAEEAKNLKWNLEIQSGKRMLQIDGKVEQFNVAFEKLKDFLPYVKDLLPPAVLQLFHQNDCTLLVGNKGLKENTKRIVSYIQPILSKLHSNLIEILGQLENAQYNTRKRGTQDNEMIADLTEKKQQLESQYDNLTKEAAAQKEEFKRDEESIQSQCDSAKRELEQLKVANSESVDDLTLKLNVAESDLEAFKLKSGKEISDYKQYMNDLAKGVKQFQLHQHGLLKTQTDMLDDADKKIAEELSHTKSKMRKLDLDSKQLRQVVEQLKKDVSAEDDLEEPRSTAVATAVANEAKVLQPNDG